MTKPASTGPHPVDITVGRRLRDRHTLMGMSQSALADAVGLTFQQIQKYERGTNRISASRLYQFASLLGVGVDYFFEDADAEGTKADLLPIDGDDPAKLREVLALVRAYYNIKDPDVRHSVFELAKSMSGD